MSLMPWCFSLVLYISAVQSEECKHINVLIKLGLRSNAFEIIGSMQAADGIELL